MSSKIISDIYKLMYSHSSAKTHKYFYGIRRLSEEFKVEPPPKNTSYTPWSVSEWNKLMKMVRTLEKFLIRHYYIHRLWSDIKNLEADIHILE